MHQTPHTAVLTYLANKIRLQIFWNFDTKFLDVPVKTFLSSDWCVHSILHIHHLYQFYENMGNFSWHYFRVFYESAVHAKITRFWRIFSRFLSKFLSIGAEIQLPWLFFDFSGRYFFKAFPGFQAFQVPWQACFSF